MQHECKITVLETKVFTDYQEKYLANPRSGPCPCFKEGDTFVLKRTSERDEFLSFDEWEILWRGMGCHQQICVHSFAGWFNHA